ISTVARWSHSRPNVFPPRPSSDTQAPVCPRRRCLTPGPPARYPRRSVCGSGGGRRYHPVRPMDAEPPARWATFDCYGTLIDWETGLANALHDLLAASIQTLGVPVDLPVTAAEAGSYKPAPGHWRRFAELSGAGPDRRAHVAVSLFHDIVPAGELGIRSVWIDRPGDVGNRAS